MKKDKLISKLDAEFANELWKEREMMLLGMIPIPEDTRTPEEIYMSEFKWAIDQDNGLYWQHPETMEQLATDGRYGKGEPTKRKFKRWARPMDL